MSVSAHDQAGWNRGVVVGGLTAAFLVIAGGGTAIGLAASGHLNGLQQTGVVTSVSQPAGCNVLTGHLKNGFSFAASDPGIITVIKGDLNNKKPVQLRYTSQATNEMSPAPNLTCYTITKNKQGVTTAKRNPNAPVNLVYSAYTPGSM
jgi:hypothetical protein